MTDRQVERLAVGGSGGNIDPETVAGFGKEWHAYDQATLASSELLALFERYFRIFPWDRLPDGAVGFDAGCGSGRWARLVAPRVATLHCIDASGEALEVARRNLTSHPNVRFHHVALDAMPFSPNSMDFGYSLGVLHHIPDTARALQDCVRPLRPGAPFLVYLYYAFDNRPGWFRTVWRATDRVRRRLSRLPFRLRKALTTVIAGLLYWPFARLAARLERDGRDITNFPLAGYRQLSFYTMRTDALDRFGTRLEKRFTREQVQAMMEQAGLENVRFSESPPYWCAVGLKKRFNGEGRATDAGRGTGKP